MGTAARYLLDFFLEHSLPALYIALVSLKYIIFYVKSLVSLHIALIFPQPALAIPVHCREAGKIHPRATGTKTEHWR